MPEIGQVTTRGRACRTGDDGAAGAAAGVKIEMSAARMRRARQGAQVKAGPHPADAGTDDVDAPGVLSEHAWRLNRSGSKAGMHGPAGDLFGASGSVVRYE